MAGMESDAPPHRTAKAILSALAVALCIKLFVLDFMIAEGDSMSPTISGGTVLVVNLAAYGLRLPGSRSYLLRWGRPQMGDIVVFPSPRGGLAVKRCVPANGGSKFYALGDNPEESYDSRSYGALPTDLIVGKVLKYR